MPKLGNNRWRAKNKGTKTERVYERSKARYKTERGAKWSVIKTAKLNPDDYIRSDHTAKQFRFVFRSDLIPS